jgi:hypothetical protein
MTDASKSDEATQTIKSPFRRVLTLNFNEISGKKGVRPLVLDGVLLSMVAGVVASAVLVPVLPVLLTPLAAIALCAKISLDHSNEKAAYERDLASKGLAALKSRRTWRESIEDKAFGEFQFSLALSGEYADMYAALQEKTGKNPDIGRAKKSFSRAVKMKWLQHKLRKELGTQRTKVSAAIASLSDTLVKDSPRHEEYDDLTNQIQKIEKTINILTQTAETLRGAHVQDSNAAWSRGVGSLMLLANPVIGLLMLSAQGSGDKAKNALEEAQQALASLQEELLKKIDVPMYTTEGDGPITQSHNIADKLGQKRDDLLEQRRTLVSEIVASKRAADPDINNILSMLEKYNVPQRRLSKEKRARSEVLPTPAMGK